MYLPRPSPQASANPSEEAAERVRGDRECQGNKQGLLNTTGLSMCELTESEATCAGPAGICTRQGPRVERKSGQQVPIPNPGAVSNG